MIQTTQLGISLDAFSQARTPLMSLTDSLKVIAKYHLLLSSIVLLYNHAASVHVLFLKTEQGSTYRYLGLVMFKVAALHHHFLF